LLNPIIATIQVAKARKYFPLGPRVGQPCCKH